jgi:hypothetical protein
MGSITVSCETPEANVDLDIQKLACPKCGRKILVEVVLFGVSHNAGITATCAECVSVNEEFRADNPEVARQIDEWKKA